ncbi:hypothetical protein BS47DRAFT_824071 [Hydnum rufescens UP504]|uniref:Gag-like protein n=1 Tax=Hydnum rufescens UP504 TaxID=1448309 RepID=A0A9P6AZS7_9AGAM|nr:hypothetical protein BS47DRAFT_824071 [Hydnum rufescens UP504]
MGSPSFIQSKSRASIQFTFVSAEYEDREPLWHCPKCGSYSHRVENCNNGARCLICTVPEAEHATSEHPEDTEAKCINCSRKHRSTDRNCPERRRRLGLAVPGPSHKPSTQVKGHEKFRPTPSKCNPPQAVDRPQDLRPPLTYQLLSRC